MAIGEVHPRKAMENANKILLTHYEIGKVRVEYDGKEYRANLRSPMTGAGFAHWKSLYEKEIAYARAMCYANHCMQYGNLGQIAPPKATEYLTATEANILKLEEEKKIKDIELDFVF